jgi:hypothetical protein
MRAADGCWFYQVTAGDDGCMHWDRMLVPCHHNKDPDDSFLDNRDFHLVL